MEQHRYIRDFCTRFRQDDTGAVTVDYVVLMALVLWITFGVIAYVWAGSVALADDVGGTVSKLEIWGMEPAPLKGE